MSELKDGGAEELISRDAAMRAVCERCARPERYGPAQSIEGSERLWHFQISDGWNAGQCGAAAIIRLPRATVPAETNARCGHYEPNWLWCERCQAWIETQHVCGAQYVDRGSDYKMVRPASTEVAGEQKPTPLCTIHQRLEDNDKLECEIGGNNCVACSLNERAALLELLAPFAAKDGSEDSLTVMRRVVDFYDTHQGENRVVVSYPAPAQPVAQPAANPAAPSNTCLACDAPTSNPYCAECTERYRAAQPEADAVDSFRIRAAHLCRDKAAKWQQNASGYNERDGMSISLTGKAAAGRELAAELEKLR